MLHVFSPIISWQLCISVNNICCVTFFVILQLQLKEKDHACRIAEDELLRIRKVKLNMGLYAVNMVKTTDSEKIMFLHVRALHGVFG